MKILNLYAGIGGNRKLWGDDIDIVAVEYDERIAAIYQDLYPNDKVIVGDAHQYLLDNYHDFDFIWASPPCPTHSVTNHFLNAQGIRRYPDMSLYQEIILLEHFFSKGGGKYVVENVVSYYNPLIPPQKSGRHYFWANFTIPKLNINSTIGGMKGSSEKRTEGQNHHKLGFDLSKYNVSKRHKHKMLNNCVHPDIGLAIFESAQNIYRHNNTPKVGLFG
jgi:DNA (cytosine-5)-methyltransferase 1